MKMTLLAHLVGKLASSPETIATESLRYILDASPDLRKVLVDRVADRAGFNRFEAESVHSEVTLETGARPDLAIYDETSKLRVLIENKFSAGLTNSQPVKYLRSLSNQPESALLFIVPEVRVVNVWLDLKKRCSQQDLKVGTETINDNMKAVSIGSGRSLLITSWRSILCLLQSTANEFEDRSVMQDVNQFCGLGEKMDKEIYLPLRKDEITDSNVARRIINYVELCGDIVRILDREGLARVGRLRGGTDYIGRTLSVGKEFQFKLWFGVWFTPWRDSGITPTWCELYRAEWGGLSGHWSTVKRVFRDYGEHKDRRCFPFFLTCSVDKDRVIKDAVCQMRKIIDKLEMATRKNS